MTHFARSTLLISFSLVLAKPVTGARQPEFRPITTWLVAACDSKPSLTRAPAPYALDNPEGWKWIRRQADSTGLLALGPETSATAAGYFAYCELVAATSAPVYLQLEAGTELELWLNQRRIYWRDFSTDHPDCDRLSVTVQPGYNSLLVAIEPGSSTWFRCSVAADLHIQTPLVGTDLLEEIEKRTFHYFLQATEPTTGLTRDSLPLSPNQKATAPASIAASGFYLSALCIGAEHGWISRAEALQRARRTVRTFLEQVEGTNGFYYHFVDPLTGKRAWNSEISSIDTALLLAGALTARNYFSDPSLGREVDELYRRVDWQWMLNGGPLLAMGWKPESGFLNPRWDSYSEHTLLYLLAIGAPRGAIDAETWYLWKRPLYTYQGRTYIQAVPLFQHQYPHCWIDFRGQRDAIADYFLNSRLATLAHRDYCLSLSNLFPHYSQRLWGITASLGPKGYMVWGGPPPTLEYPIDGSIVPCAAGGSLPFATNECLAVLEEIVNRYPDQAWTPLGFTDAFNPQTGWRAPSALSIDQGPLLLMAENTLSGKVWEWFMQSAEVRTAMYRVGFCRYGSDLQPADKRFLRKIARQTWDCLAHFVHPATGLPYDSSDRGPHTSASNIGLYLASLAAARDMGFISHTDALSRAEKVLTALEQMKTWEGFRQCWHSVIDLSDAEHDRMISLVDSANLALGMIVAANAFAELHDRFYALINAMNWSAFYDPEKKMLHGGYDLAKHVFPTNWYIDLLAGDARSAVFLAIALDDVPLAAWDNLNRRILHLYHTDFFFPGWEGGNLFMQYLPGIFLPERGTSPGRSAANLAYCDIMRARLIGAPVWGWSSCVAPTGEYLGWGRLTNTVVTPHASVLAVEDFAPEVFENLIRLQQMGAAAPWRENDREYAFGFRDSINWKTGQVAEKYLMLDQGMLFLSLANYLEDGIVRRYVTADPRIADALARIPDLARSHGPESISTFYTEADLLIRSGPQKRSLRVPFLAAAPTIDGDLGDWSDIDGGEIILRFPDDSEMGSPLIPRRFAARVQVAWDPQFLYLAAAVSDDDLVCRFPAPELYRGDCLELFIDPACDGFYWGSRQDFQIGLAPAGPDGKPLSYAFFQNQAPAGLLLAAAANAPKDSPADYTIEAAIPWSFLGVDNPTAGRNVCASFAVHTVDQTLEHDAKLNWSYVPQPDHIQLGTLILTGPEK